MYWVQSEKVFHDMQELAKKLQPLTVREQADQVFSFPGRKSRPTVSTILNCLLPSEGVVCDPMAGSGIIPYAALDLGHKVVANDWEPYAYRLATAPFRLPDNKALATSMNYVTSELDSFFRKLYWTKCTCGHDHVLDSLFYDRITHNYKTPQSHTRMGPNGENVVYRGKYRCPACKATEKRFDDEDAEHLARLEATPVGGFPNTELIPNSRINFTAPHFTKYRNLFPHRAQLAITALWTVITQVQDERSRMFLEDAVLSILPQAKFVDYHTNMQDPHCPEYKNRENNLWHRFLQRLDERSQYLSRIASRTRMVQGMEELQRAADAAIVYRNLDFRDFLQSLPDEGVDIVITDPPWGDAIPFFEKAQFFHPFLSYSLQEDTARLSGEVVVTNAPSRGTKAGREQFLADIHALFTHMARVLKVGRYVVLYFRPEQGHWISDLAKLKLFARMHGLEPLPPLVTEVNDPSMRVLAAERMTFARDVVFPFVKVEASERRWYEGEDDIDQLVCHAAVLAAEHGQKALFTWQDFWREMTALLRAHGLQRLMAQTFAPRIEQTLQCYTKPEGVNYRLSSFGPYRSLLYADNAEMRIRDVTPGIVQDLGRDGRSFRFEDFVLAMMLYVDDSTRDGIKELQRAEKSVLQRILLEHVEEDHDTGLFGLRRYKAAPPAPGMVNVLSLTPTQFEELVCELFRLRNYTDVRVVGHSGDGGVDVIGISPMGEREVVQCKRYAPGNNVGSTPVQRVDSFRRTRDARRGWVITTSDFTPQGKAEAELAMIHIVNGQQLITWLDAYFPGKFYIR